MNLRVIKKDIEYYVGSFIEDCSLFVALNPGKGAEGIYEIVDKAVDLYNDLRNKVNALPDELVAKPTTPAEKKERSKKLSGYYNGIIKEMIEELDTLSEDLSEVISKEVAEK